MTGLSLICAAGSIGKPCAERGALGTRCFVVPNSVSVWTAVAIPSSRFAESLDCTEKLS